MGGCAPGPTARPGILRLSELPVKSLISNILVYGVNVLRQALELSLLTAGNKYKKGNDERENVVFLEPTHKLATFPAFSELRALQNQFHQGIHYLKQ